MTVDNHNTTSRTTSSADATAVLVLSVAGSALEDRIAAAIPGRLRVAVPRASATTRQATGASYPLYPVADWSDLDEFLAIAHTIDASATVGEVVAAIEPAVAPAAFVRTMLGMTAGIDYETALRCTDKHLMKQALAAAGLPVAAHQVAYAFADIPDAADELGGYPIVVKPRGGFGAINTHIVNTPADLLALADTQAFGAGVTEELAAMLTPTGVGAGLAASDRGFLVEDYIHTVAEYHCEILRADGHTVYAIPGQYLTPLISDDEVLGSILLDPGSATGAWIIRLAEDATTALGVRDGFAHAELLKDRDGRWWVGEVGARRGGAALSSMINLAYGFNPVDLDARWATGEIPNPQVAAQPGVFGWAGVRIQRTGHIASIASRPDLLAQPDVIDAVILTQPGAQVAAGGSGLFAGYVFYHADTVDDVLVAMRTTAERLQLHYADTPTAE